MFGEELETQTSIQLWTKNYNSGPCVENTSGYAGKRKPENCPWRPRWGKPWLFAFLC